MPSPSSLPSQPDPLQPVLDDAEAELRRRLHEACEAEAKGLSTDSTQEIRHLEDTLLAAAVAAGQTISVRSHMKRRTPAERERPISINEGADRKGNAKARSERSPEEFAREYGKESDTRVREFTDETGLAWRAWPVVPGLSRASASGRSFLGNFQDGWICFEGLSTTARRRLPCRRPDWTAITDEDLRHLLAQAIDAPERATKRQDKP
jgi:hypothetical protein